MLYVYAIIIGVLVGFSIGAGAALMFKAPSKQGLGAFRTLGEINGSEGDPISHFGFGLGFFITSAAAAAGTGALTQDVQHRIIPNWAAALVSLGNKKAPDKQIMIKSPIRMGIAGAIVGVVIIPILIGIPQLIPEKISVIAKGILGSAANWLFKYVMPVLFLLAALSASKFVGLWSIGLAVIFQFTSGNSLPGIILGIILGSIQQEKGYKSRHFILMLLIVVTLWILIAYFRGLFTTNVDKWLAFKT